MVVRSSFCPWTLMDLAEATRLYQATLTACRSAVDAEGVMDEELEAAKREMELAYLRHLIGAEVKGYSDMLTARANRQHYGKEADA